MKIQPLCSVSHCWESLLQPGRLDPAEPFRNSHEMAQVYRKEGSSFRGLVTKRFF